MTMTDRTALIECLVAEVYNQGNLAAIQELFTPTVLVDGYATTIEEFSDSIHCLRQMFPDLRVTLDTFCEVGELVAVHWTAQHYGPSMPANRQHDRPGGRTDLRLFRIVHGRIVEVWYNWTALEQLEAQGVLHLAKLPARFTGNVY